MRVSPWAKDAQPSLKRSRLDSERKTVLFNSGCFLIRLGCSLEHWKYPRSFEVLGNWKVQRPSKRIEKKQKKKMSWDYSQNNNRQELWFQIFQRLMIVGCWIIQLRFKSWQNVLDPEDWDEEISLALGKGQESEHRKTAKILLLRAHRNVKPKMESKLWSQYKLQRIV